MWWDVIPTRCRRSRLGDDVISPRDVICRTSGYLPGRRTLPLIPPVLVRRLDVICHYRGRYSSRRSGVEMRSTPGGQCLGATTEPWSLRELTPFYCLVIYGMIINKKTYHNGQRVVSRSSASVLKLPKINVSGKYTTILISKKSHSFTQQK